MGSVEAARPVPSRRLIPAANRLHRDRIACSTPRQATGLQHQRSRAARPGPRPGRHLSRPRAPANRPGDSTGPRLRQYADDVERRAKAAGPQGAGYTRIGTAWGVTRQAARTKWKEAAPDRGGQAARPIPLAFADGTATTATLSYAPAPPASNSRFVRSGSAWRPCSAGCRPVPPGRTRAPIVLAEHGSWAAGAERETGTVTDRGWSAPVGRADCECCVGVFGCATEQSAGVHATTVRAPTARVLSARTGRSCCALPGLLSQGRRPHGQETATGRA